MLLNVVEIVDFLSVKGTIKVNLDRKVTVLLGSNDHGKTNILEAVKHLNDEVPIAEDEANWDAEGPPVITFGFSMSPAERSEWKNLIE
jgi:predicted ATP-dependent endonuclease of OLD family